MARIDHNQNSVVRKLGHRDVRGLMAYNKLYSSCLEGILGLAETLEHKVIMAEVCVGVVVSQAEGYEKRFFEGVGFFDGVLEGVVVFGALSGLHPVKHVPSAAYRLFI